MSSAGRRLLTGLAGLALLGGTSAAVAEERAPAAKPSPATTVVDRLDPELEGLAIDTQGRAVLMSGPSFQDRPVLLARILPGGGPDRSYGPRGVVGKSFTEGDDDILVSDEITVDSQDRALVPFRRQYDDGTVHVARCLADGNVDPAWGEGGVASLDVGSFAGVYDIAVDASERVVLAGVSQAAPGRPWHATVIRLLDDGSPDPAFGTAGLARFEKDAAAVELELDDRGRIVITVGHRIVRRLLESGAPDPAYGKDGATSLEEGPPIQDLSVDSAGRAVVDQSPDRPGRRIDLTRLTADGQLDRTFGGDGRAPIKLAREIGGAIALATDPRGRIVVGATALDRPKLSADFVLTRVSERGTTDRSFGEKGAVVFDVREPDDRLKTLALAPDGAIVVAGATKVGAKRRVAVVRYSP